MILWTCPNGCGSVRGPTRPRRDNVCRYCLPCSKKAGKLVERVAPTSEKKRAARAERRNEKAKVRRERRHAHRGMGPETPTRFRCGEPVEFLVRPDIWPKGLAFVMVRPSTRRRASRVESRGVTVYDFDGADVHDAKAITVVGIARWRTDRALKDGRLSEDGARTAIRQLVEFYLKVRPRLGRLKDAEEEVARLLRGAAAVDVILGANQRNDGRTG